MTLTIQDLGAFGELLSAVAVLATLVYLTLQTRQNTMAIAAQLDAASLGEVQNIRLTATSSELGEALNQNRVDPRPIEEDRCEFYWGALIASVQWHFHQIHSGLLPSFSEARLRRSIGNLFNIYRGFEGFWETVKASYAPDSVERVEEQRSKAA